MFDYIIVRHATIIRRGHADTARSLRQILVMLTLELTAIKGAKQYLELGDLPGL